MKKCGFICSWETTQEKIKINEIYTGCCFAYLQTHFLEKGMDRTDQPYEHPPNFKQVPLKQPKEFSPVAVDNEPVLKCVVPRD